jgi:ubiquitin C
MSGNIQIFVRLLNGGTITLSRHPDDTIEDVMNAIEDQTGIPIAQQRLIFGGRQLDPSQTLSQSGIQAGSTLHLVGRVIGGAQIFRQGHCKDPRQGGPSSGIARC